MKIKVGPKGRHVEIPEGWERVESGLACKDDRFLNLMYFEKGTVVWSKVDKEDLECGLMAADYWCLMRSNRLEKHLSVDAERGHGRGLDEE